MSNGAVVLGTILMFVGLGVVLVAVLRALRDTWTLGWYELSVPLIGFALILLGRWLVG